MKKQIISTLTALSLTAAAFAGTATFKSPALEADTRSDSWLDGDYALGTWGGLRTRLAEKGVTFDGYYVNNIAGNPVGGKNPGGFTYTDNFYLGVTLDLGKLVGWRGGEFAISGINRDGRSLTNDYVGSQYNSQQVFGGQNIFFYALTLEQKFWDDKARLKIGRFSASDDFNGSPLYGLYMNNGFDGDIRNVLFDTQFSAYPFSTWAARFRLDPTPEINAQIGVFQTWSNIFNRETNGLDWGIHSNDGVFLIAQLGWSPEFFKRPVTPSANGKPDAKTVTAPEMKGLPGHYWIGGSLSPWNGYAQFGTSQMAGNSYGFYVHADQMVYQESPGSDQGLTLWAASGYYPQQNISIVPFQVSFGTVYTGLIPTRDKDRTIFGLLCGKFSGNYANTVQSSGAGKPSTESVLELAHRIQLTKFVYIQPDLQWIIRPAGTGNIPNALVIGAQMGVTF